MGVSEALASLAVRHAHVLLVEVPGWWRLRVEAEQAVLARGWQLALSPADADVLVVCGEPGPRVEAAVALVWEQLPGPRVRVDVREYDDVVARLAAAHAELLDTARHREDARSRPGAGDLLEHEQDADHDGDMDHGDMDHGDMDHGDMDHGDMEMSPGGLPLAGGGDDRDGLEMDVLEVHLGPGLPHWPAGLVLRCSLQGDLVTAAQAEVLDAAPSAEAAAAGARRLDNVVALLSMAGWEHGASLARALRDAALDGDADAPATGLERLGRRVRRSWPLRWSLRGVRPVTVSEAAEHGLPASACGDTRERLLHLLDPRPDEESPGPFPVDALAHLVTGLDLATARLVVASLDVQELRAPEREHEVSHG